MPISIKGLDKAEVLAALNAAAVPGALHGGYKAMPPIDRDEAADMLQEQQNFAYINGRCMKLSFIGDELHELEYDHANRANGSCLALRVIQRLRDTDNEFVKSVGALAGLTP